MGWVKTITAKPGKIDQGNLLDRKEIEQLRQEDVQMQQLIEQRIKKLKE